MRTMNAIRLWAGAHPELTPEQVASYFDVKVLVVLTALGKGDWR